MAWPLTTILRLGLVPLNGDCTIQGAKTFDDTLGVEDIFFGARSRTITRGAGSTQPITANSDCWITTDGAIEIPELEGWRCWLVLGGDHDISFGSTTCDVSAEGWGTGDILRVQVDGTPAIKVWRAVAAADLGAFV